MYAKSLVLATALAMATSVAANEPDRPRIYFPREVKREYTNNTITKSASSSSAASPTTKRDLLNDLISEILASNSAESKPASSTTVDKTLTPPSDPPTSGSGAPKITLLPTTRVTETKESLVTRTKEESTDSAIVIGPTGIVSTSKEPITTQQSSLIKEPTTKEPVAKEPTTKEPTTKEQSTEAPKPTSTSIDSPPVKTNTLPTTTTTGGGILDPIESLVTRLLPRPSSTTTQSAQEPVVSLNSTNPAQSSGGPSTTTRGGILDPIESLVTRLLPRPSSTASLQSSGGPSTTTRGGILDPIETFLTRLLPRPSSTTTTSAQEPVVSVNTTVPVQSSGGSGPSTTQTQPGILPTLTSLLPIGDSTTTTPAATVNSTVGPATTGTQTGGILPSLTSLLPIGGSSTVSLSIQPLPVTTTASGITTTSRVPLTTTTDIPIVNGTSTTATGPVKTSTAITDVPTTNGTVTAPTTTQTALSSTLAPVDNTTAIVTSQTTASTSSKPPVVPITSTSTASQTTVPTSTKEPVVTSIRPTATISSTDNWLPTTIVIEPTTFSFNAPATTATDTTSQALPTTIPKIIFPDDPNKPAPAGSVPIQIGFTFPLNYVFVSSNTVAAAQIFKFLPRALADASGIDIDKLQISKLVPYNTQSTWGYVTTIAQLNYPATLVDTLQMDLWSPNSALYNNADPIVRSLTALFNPKIDIHGNINDGGSNGGSNGGNNGNNNNDAFGGGNGGDQSSKQKATTAGIAVAALGFSVMYGAAMFIIARRYKRKRQGHRRASSITSSPASDMRYNGNGSPALMGGALMSRNASTYGAAGARDSHGSGGHQSARTANISAPVATENSLGWN